MILAAALLPNVRLLHAGPAGHGQWPPGPLASRTQAEREAESWCLRLTSEQTQLWLPHEGLATHLFLFNVAVRKFLIACLAHITFLLGNAIVVYEKLRCLKYQGKWNVSLPVGYFDTGKEPQFPTQGFRKEVFKR